MTSNTNFDWLERLIINKLVNWKNSPYRKPLILKGVRQVGKTWLLREFGRQYYDNTAYFNFKENTEYGQFRIQARDIDAIQEALCGILNAYEWDFAKHPNTSEFPKLSLIWHSIPSQLARENKRL